MTFDGSTANVYQNGTLVGTNSYTGSITSTSNFTLGGRAGGVLFPDKWISENSSLGKDY